MNLIDLQFKKIKEDNRIALMTHVVVGYPDLETTEKVVLTMAQNGADFIELQIPFSDPLADGPTIMKACEESLRNGTKVADAFKLMKKLSKEVSIPLLFMGYYNTVFKYGTEKFCRDAKEAGASGLIIPDMPLDEEPDEGFIKFAKEFNLYPIRVISPASTDDRLKKNAAIAKGFVYCMARQGITGAQKDLDPSLIEYLKRVRKYFNVPLAVGFGISKKEHVQALKGHADTAIIGSAVIDLITKSPKVQITEKIIKFINTLKAGEYHAD